MKTRHRFRAEWHDYNAGTYFVTVCTENRRHYFGEINDGIMNLSELGMVLTDSITKADTESDFDIPLFVVMPNHFHMILHIGLDCDNNDVENLGALKPKLHPEETDESSPFHHNSLLSWRVGTIKAAVSRYANRHNIKFGWQKRFHEHIIRNPHTLNEIAYYIENNVNLWKNDCFNI